MSKLSRTIRLNVGDEFIPSATENFENLSRISKVAYAARKNFSNNTFFFVPYLTVSISLIIAEAVIVGFPYSTLESQKIVLAISTFFCFFGVIGFGYHIPSEVEGFYDRLQVICLDGVLFFEIILICLGWICLYREMQGFASLRILRVFRYLWYFQLNNTKKVPYNSISHMSLRCVQYMNNLGKDLFTSSSKGGLMIIAVYFFLTYAVAVAVWTEQVRPSCNRNIAISYLKDRGRKSLRRTLAALTC